MTIRPIRTFRYKNPQVHVYQQYQQHGRNVDTGGSSGNVRSRRAWSRVKLLMLALMITSSIAGV